MGTNFFDFTNIISSEKSAFDYMRGNGLLLNASYCEDCEVWRGQTVDRSRSDNCWFKCTKCAEKEAIRSKSFFSGSKKSLVIWLTVIYFFCFQIPVTTACRMLNGEINEKTAIDYYNYLRDICTGYFQLNPIMLGGVGHIVEIDESKLGRKRKAGRGAVRNAGGPWVFGAIDRTTKQVVLFTVPDKKAETLLPLIQRHVRPGTTIHSDEAAMYNRLGQHGYDHHTVNHSIAYVAPDGTHTNTIEGFWGHMKANIKAKYGVVASQRNAHLDELMYWWNRGKNANSFDTFLADIRAQYPDTIAQPRLYQPVPVMPARPDDAE